MSSNDTKPPRIFSTVTSNDVTYNLDFVTYLINTEIQRRAVKNEPPMSQEDLNKDVQAATLLKPTIRRQLNG
jgi:hypothetical protein